MKGWARILLWMLLSSSFLYAKSGESSSKLIAKKSLAIRAAAQELVQLLEAQSQWVSKENQELSGQLSGIMLEDSTSYRNKAKGEALAEAWLQEWRRLDFEKEMLQVIKTAQAQSPLPLQAETVQARMTVGWEVQREQGAADFSAAAIKEVYPIARAVAVAEQKRYLEEGLRYPSQPEVDEMFKEVDIKRKQGPLPLKGQDFQSLKSKVRPESIPVDALFDELDQEPTRLADAVVRILAGQYLQQVAAASAPLRNEALSAGVFTAKEMENVMAKSLREGLSANLDARPPIYAGFAIVHEWVENAAQQWEEDRVAAFLKVWPEGSLDVETLREWMQEAFPRHVAFEESLALLQQKTMGARGPLLAAALASAAPEARRMEIKTYFEQSLKTAGGSGLVWRAHVEAVLRRKMPPLRQRIAQTQVADLFPNFGADKPPAESVVAWFYDQNLKEAQTFPQLTEALALDPDWAFAPDPEEPLLAEAETLARETLNQDLVPALKSLEAQLQLLRDMEREGMDALKTKVLAGEKTEELYKRWLKEWEKRWQGIRDQQSLRWQARFARTENELRKTVRQWYETVKDTPFPEESTVSETASAEKGTDIEEPSSPEMIVVEVPLHPVSEPQGPEEEVQESGDSAAGDEAQPGGIQEELEEYRGMADGILAFSDMANGDCRLLFGSPDGKGVLTVGFDPGDVEASAQKIAESLRGPLLEVLNGTASAHESKGFRLFTKSKEPTLSMLFQVDSPKIRHQMSIQVRKMIQKEIEAWAKENGQKAPTLLWQDEMSF